VLPEKNGDQLDQHGEKLLYSVKEDRNILQTVKREEDNWIGHILYKFCLSENAAV
jgi:hypothetical protein